MECEGERKRHKENGKSGNDPPSYDGSLGREGERGRVRGTESGAARECESKSERREKRGRERKREREGEARDEMKERGGREKRKKEKNEKIERI